MIKCHSELVEVVGNNAKHELLLSGYLGPDLSCQLYVYCVVILLHPEGHITLYSTVINYCVTIFSATYCLQLQLTPCSFVCICHIFYPGWYFHEKKNSCYDFCSIPRIYIFNLLYIF